MTELERANEILKTSAAFFAQAELDCRLRPVKSLCEAAGFCHR